MKKFIIFITMFCLFSGLNYYIKADYPVAENKTSSKLELSSRKVVLDIKQKIAIRANQKVVWKSSNKKIATISKKGIIQAKRNGKVNVIARSLETNERKILKVYCGGYKITKSRFPDSGFRKYIKIRCDYNKDGYLSNKERNCRVMYINPNEWTEGSGEKKLLKQIEKIKNLKGIKYFYNLQGVSISGINGLKNIDFSNMKKLVFFEVYGNKVKNVYADYCPKLVGFEINRRNNNFFDWQ